VVEKAHRCVDRGVGLGHGRHPAIVVGMAVGDDHRRDRPGATMGTVEGQRRGGGLVRHQRVDDDDPGVALDDRHVGQVQAPDLIDAVGYLEQPVLGHELSLSPEARVRGRRAFGIHEVVPGAVPHRAPVGVLDDRVVQGGDEPAGDIVEVGPVVPSQCRHPHRPPLLALSVPDHAPRVFSAIPGE